MTIIQRRDFITLLGSAAAWPLAAGAQQGNRIRRIGVLIGLDENDPVAKLRLSAFTQALADLGCADGRNARVDVYWAGDNTIRIRALAHELVDLQPDIIVTPLTQATVALQRETRTIPIVFAGVADPIASGILPRLARPSGNITGFAGLGEASLGGKWLELLSEIAPGLKRAAIMFNPEMNPASVYMPSFETAARSLKVETIIAPVHSDLEIETRDGGLLSYGVDPVDAFRRAATYVDRILRGTKPAELPVQLPTKFEMILNRKTATALGLAIPPSIMLRADEVVE
jgi:putative ABC transport system substrate-binding protein